MADELAQLLDQFAGRWNLEPTSPDAQGQYLLELDGRLRLTLTQIGTQVYLEGTPGALPADRHLAGERLRTLLAATLTGRGQAEEVLSLDPDRDELVLFRCLAAPDLALDEFERHLEGFANRLDFFMQLMTEPSRSAPPLTVLYP